MSLSLLLCLPNVSPAAPAIGVGPSSLTFTCKVYSAISSQILSITNTGSGTLNYTIQSDMFWLSVDNPTCSLATGASTTHVVRVATRGLAPRTYKGSLTIRDPTATNSPKMMAVSLQIQTGSRPRQIVAWGSNGYGQTNVPADLMNAVAVAPGFSQVLALCSDGNVEAWGNNTFGQTNAPVGLTNAVAVNGGNYHSLALCADGTVVAWGYNNHGQANPPSDLTNTVAVAGGGLHSLALRGDGTVVAWGYNSQGQTNVPAGLTNAVAVDAGDYYSLALRADGTVVAWGDDSYGQTRVPAGLTNAVAVAAGGYFSVALRADGTVVAWGFNAYGQVNVPANLTNVVAITAGSGHTLALRADGTVVAWGANSFTQTNVPVSLTNALVVAAGGNCSMALVPEVSLIVTSPYGLATPSQGTNWVPQNSVRTCSVDPVVQGSTQFACRGWSGSGSVPASGVSNRVSFVITNDSAITWLWGTTNYWLDVSVPDGGSVTPGSGWYTAGTNVTLTVSNWPTYAFLGWYGDTNGCAINGATITVSVTRSLQFGARFTTPLIAVSSPNLVYSGPAYSAIAPQILAITNAGSGTLKYTLQSDMFWLSVDNPTGMLTSGASMTHVVRVATRGLAPRVYRGRLKISDPAATNSPQFVPVSLEVGSLVPPSLVVAWGVSTSVPADLTDAVAVAAGGTHSLALRMKGNVTAWGDNTYGQTNVPTGLTNAVAVTGGGNHSVALRTDGSVVSWGDNAYGQTNVTSSLTNAVAVDGGGRHSLALRDDGTVVAWGDNSAGQTNIPAGVTNVVAVSGGDSHSLALRSDGTVVAWGANTWRQTNVPTGLTNAVAVSAGWNHSLALRADGTVLAWGVDWYGDVYYVPSDLTNAVTVAAGQFYSLAMRGDGTIVAWGSAGVPTGLTNAVAMSSGCGSGNNTLALEPAVSLLVTSLYGLPTPTQGTNWVVRDAVQTCWVEPVVQGTTQFACKGWTGSGSVPLNGSSNRVSFVITNASAITWLWKTNFCLDIQTTGCGSVVPGGGWYAAGTNVTQTASNWPGHTFLGWGGDTNGCTTNGATILVPMTRPRQIVARFTGPVIAVGSSSLVFSGQLFGSVAPQVLTITNTGEGPLNYTIRSEAFWSSVDTPACTLVAGAFTTHVVRVATRGLAPCVYEGRLTITDPTATNSPKSVGVSLQIGNVTPPSLVVAWGDDRSGQTDVPSGLTNPVAVAGGGNHSLALRADGTVAAWGANDSGQTNVPSGLTNAVAVAAGWAHSLALRADRSVVAWGDNSCGQSTVPSGLTNAVALAGGGWHSLALQADGTVVAWGYGGAGETRVPSGLTNAVAIAAGRYHSLALRADGTVVAWGDNCYGQLSMPATLTNAVAVSGGSGVSLMQCSDGTVVVRGYDGAGQTSVPSGLTNAVVASSGWDHLLALQADGTVVAWGDNTYGQTTVPANLTNVVAVSGGAYHSLALAPAASLVVISPAGSPLPDRGTNWVIRNAVQMCWVDPAAQQGATQRLCKGWTGTGSAPASGTSNNVSFVITNNSSVTWLWGNTNYWLSISGAVHGTAAPTSGWYRVASNLQIQASANAYYHFDSWTGTVISATNPLNLTVTRPETVTAQFAENLTTNAIPEWWLAQHGLTNRAWSVEALDDQDHDGAPTWCEWGSDTDPFDSNSVLRVFSLIPGTNGVRIAWQGGTGVCQYVERKQNLTQTSEVWTVIFTNQPPTGLSTNRLDSAGTNGPFFYRIRAGR